MKIVILDGAGANPGDITWAPLERLGEVTAYDYTAKDQVVERSKDAEICITNKTVFDADTLQKLPALKYIGVLATGYNVVDLEECRKLGITVTNVPEYATYATAQMTIALLLELASRPGMHSNDVMDGGWCKSPQFSYFLSPLTELWGKNMLIFGFGKIGQRVAAIASSLGMNVSAVPHRFDSDSAVIDGYKIPFTTFDEGLKTADVISVHCPLTNETRNLINKERLAAMKKGAILINCARGPVVDEKAVREALDSGILGGYGADVVSVEPMLPDNPLLGAPNCVITPHIAWAAKETRERLIYAAADNLEAFLKGSPINVVN
ncbi:MAG: D-2-hydroxyacid dehydrogenase [Ruminococcaceae bacterium]|nr:D-2-hydroxyacid dehydrogenase [Oscillospiraceae bacterium]